MRASLANLLGRFAAVVGCAVALLAQSGCGTKIRFLPKVAAVTQGQVEARFDTDSQGGVDGGQAHLSGAFKVMNVAISGNQDRAEGTSASFKVRGGIYVQ